VTASFRGFFALPLPKGTRDALAEAQARLRHEAAREGLDLRWTRREQLHVTLVFLGTMPRTHAERLRGILAEVAAPRATLPGEITAIGVFGPPARARILQASLPDPTGAIGELADALADAVVPLGVEREVRPFRPHVTLGRFRTPGDARRLLAVVSLPRQPFSFDRVHLYASEPRADGSHYTLLAAQMLGEPSV
jgi:RNA 2',3'-cyclic 3'-phosphodiesterase